MPQARRMRLRQTTASAHRRASLRAPPPLPLPSPCPMHSAKASGQPPYLCTMLGGWPATALAHGAWQVVSYRLAAHSTCVPVLVPALLWQPLFARLPCFSPASARSSRSSLHVLDGAQNPYSVTLLTQHVYPFHHLAASPAKYTQDSSRTLTPPKHMHTHTRMHARTHNHAHTHALTMRMHAERRHPYGPSGSSCRQAGRKACSCGPGVCVRACVRACVCMRACEGPSLFVYEGQGLRDIVHSI